MRKDRRLARSVKSKPHATYNSLCILSQPASIVKKYTKLIISCCKPELTLPLRPHFSAALLPLPTHADDARGDQLLHICADLGILHMLLQGRGVVLGLLQDALHDGVLQDRHDLLQVSGGAGARSEYGKRKLTSGSFWIRSSVCASVSPSRAENCAWIAFCCCCSISRIFLPSLSCSMASVHTSMHLLYSRMAK